MPPAPCSLAYEAGQDFASTPEGERAAVLIESQWRTRLAVVNMIEMATRSRTPHQAGSRRAAIVNLAAAVRAAAELRRSAIGRPFFSEFAAADRSRPMTSATPFSISHLGLAALAERTLGSLTESGGAVPRLPDEAAAMNDSIRAEAVDARFRTTAAALTLTYRRPAPVAERL